MEWGVKQLQAFLNAFLAQPKSASCCYAAEPYAAFLAAMAPSAASLAGQRAHPPAPAPLFMLVLLGQWEEGDWAPTLASLAAQSYPRFSITRNPTPSLGDYMLHLWPGDTLAPDCLYHFALAAAQGKDLIYCDEDICFPGEAGGRAAPFFKSEASRITALSYDMLSCGVAASRKVFRRAGPPADGGPEARYAYNLRCLAACRHPQHIPLPLYTLSRDRLVGHGLLQTLEPPLSKGEVAVAGQWPGSLRVERMQKRRPSVAIIIPNQDNMTGLRRLLESIETQSLYPYGPILIADLGSRDAQTLRYYALLEKNRAARVIRGPGSLGKLLNQAARSAKAEVLIFLRPDAEILAPDWIESLLGQLYRAGVGAAGGKLVDGLGRLRFCGGITGLSNGAPGFYAASADSLTDLRQNRFAASIRTVSFLSLSCLALRAACLGGAGGFAEEPGLADPAMELCLRLGQRGQACVYTPYALLRCHGAPDTPADISPIADPHCSPHYDPAQSAPLCRMPDPFGA